MVVVEIEPWREKGEIWICYGVSYVCWIWFWFIGIKTIEGDGILGGNYVGLGIKHVN